jgi:DNA-binding XRE family transcriptional regulator/PHD/YefM family antitoxin component YafN of YafNO toxin-antitoxin module
MNVYTYSEARQKLAALLEKGGKPEWAVIPYEEYERLLEAIEMAEDVRVYDEAKQAIRSDEELIPAEVTYAILDGINPVRAWREHRGLTQQALAQAAVISVPYLSQIESGRRTGSAEVLASLARALGRSVDDLLTP